MDFDRLIDGWNSICGDENRLVGQFAKIIQYSSDMADRSSRLQSIHKVRAQVERRAGAHDRFLGGGSRGIRDSASSPTSRRSDFFLNASRTH